MKALMLFSVLVLAGLAVGQPIEGPYIVLEAGGGTVLKDPHITLRADSLADIFYVQNSGDSDAVRLVSFSLVSEEVVSGPEVLFQEAGWAQDITDVENQTDGSWAAAILSASGGYSVLWALIATPNETSATELDHSSCAGEWCSWLQAESISSRIGGGWLANWIWGMITDIYYEPAFFPKVAFFDGTNLESTLEASSQSFLYGPTGIQTISFAPDTVFVLLSQIEGFGWVEGSLLKIVPPLEDPYGEFERALPCTWNNLRFERTHEGRLLVFSGVDGWYPEYPHPRIVEVDTTGNCLELYALPLDRDPDAIAWHPDYGFAALLVYSARIMLARVDTNGVEVQPLGVFWEATEGNRIVEANLAIAEDGRVVVLWIELDETNAAVLKIGAVGWDTFLGVEQTRAEVIPEKISLSAYPNPFNMTATISFELPRAREIRIRIYDVTGREVRELVKGMQTAGDHELRYDASGLASGIYFVRLTAGDLAVTTKALLIK